MVKLRMAQPDVQARGWLLDGYPRSASQAEAIEREGIRPDVFILMNVPDAVLIERVVGRRLDPVTGDIYHLKRVGWRGVGGVWVFWGWGDGVWVRAWKGGEEGGRMQEGGGVGRDERRRKAPALTCPPPAHPAATTPPTDNDDDRFKPPPAEIVPRLQVRSDDTEEKARTRLATHASNVAAVLGYYKAQLVELDGNRSMCAPFPSLFYVLRRCALPAARRAARWRSRRRRDMLLGVFGLLLTRPPPSHHPQGRGVQGCGGHPVPQVSAACFMGARERGAPPAARAHRRFWTPDTRALRARAGGRGRASADGVQQTQLCYPTSGAAPSPASPRLCGKSGKIRLSALSGTCGVWQRG